MNYRSFFISLVLVLCLVDSRLNASAAFQYEGDTTIYLLTCSPGTEVYSAFGHNALMCTIGRDNDVYNYGTFDFNTDNFVLKFARGQLPYALSVQKFEYFQLEYLHDRRQVVAQELNLDAKATKKLIDLLNENALPENRLYRYDFFYDNCATRLRDVLNAATDNQINWNLKPNHTEYTFRDLIDIYAGDLEWTELGIDIALGLPCDKVLEPGEQDFLPDSLRYLADQAQIGKEPLVLRETELLPGEEQVQKKTIFQRTGITIALVSLVLGLFMYVLRTSKFQITLAKFLLGINGLIGLMVFSLWFLTDHNATAMNMNLLWANPLNIIFIFMSFKKWWKVFFALNCITLITWVVNPQNMHESLLPLIALFMAASLILILNKKGRD